MMVDTKTENTQKKQNNFFLIDPKCIAIHFNIIHLSQHTKYQNSKRWQTGIASNMHTLSYCTLLFYYYSTHFDVFPVRFKCHYLGLPIFVHRLVGKLSPLLSQLFHYAVCLCSSYSKWDHFKFLYHITKHPTPTLTSPPPKEKHSNGELETDTCYMSFSPKSLENDPKLDFLH